MNQMPGKIPLRSLHQQRNEAPSYPDYCYCLQDKCKILAIGHKCKSRSKALNIYRCLVIEPRAGMRCAAGIKSTCEPDKAGVLPLAVPTTQSFDHYLLHRVTPQEPEESKSGGAV